MYLSSTYTYADAHTYRSSCVYMFAVYIESRERLRGKHVFEKERLLYACMDGWKDGCM